MKDNSIIIKKIEKFAFNMRLNILETAYKTGGKNAHIGGALSIVEILSTLYSYKLKLNKNNFKDKDRNRLILSKGHSVLGYYSALHQIGLISLEELYNYEKPGTFLFGHPVKNRDKGIEFSNGSLGMGLGVGIGLALSAKRKDKKFNTYVIIGDGECNEGSVWEAAMAAPKFKLNNIFAIIDKNNFQQTGSNEEIMPSLDMTAKWEKFGWDVKEIDGHNIREILNGLESNIKIDQPRAIIAKTIKGKGFSFSESNNNWHHNVLSSSIYEQAIAELNTGRKKGRLSGN